MPLRNYFECPDGSPRITLPKHVLCPMAGAGELEPLLFNPLHRDNRHYRGRYAERYRSPRSKGRMHPISDSGGGPNGGPLLQNTLTNCFSGLNICHISSIHLNFIIKRATFLLPDSQNAVVDKPLYQVFACGCLICLRLGAISAHVGRTGVQCATSRYDRTRCDALKGLKQS